MKIAGGFVCIVLMSSLVRAKLYTWYVPKMQSVAENNCSGLAILRCGVAVQFAFFFILGPKLR